jgi:M6 family metalloprotease-like protein
MSKRSLIIMFVILAGFLFLVALPGDIVQASPASPVTFTLTQPDGTSFTAIKWGDETMNGYETLDGYAIAQDMTSGGWYYLTASPDGTLTPATMDSVQMLVGRDDPTGLKKHLRPTQSASPSPEILSPEVISEVDSPPSDGIHRVAVFLVGFPDAGGRSDPSEWANLIFGGYGSLKDYYQTVSYGAVTITPANESSGVVNDGIIGWLDLSAYYSSHPNPWGPYTNVNRYITKRALQVGDAFINFADYDTDGNGSISSDELHIIIVVAGFERSFSDVSSPAVWAHNSDLSGIVGAPTLDGKVIADGSRKGSYSQVGEFLATSPNHILTMGVLAHEFGHDLRWPDLYDIDHSSSGVGDWSLMGTGLWNGLAIPGDSPAFPDAWSRWYQGWITPTTISGYSYGQAITQVESSSSAYLLRTNTDAVDWLYLENSGQGEFFLVENRQLTSYDSALPGCGLLVWHVDETVRYDDYANANEKHPLLKLIEADGLYELSSGVDQGDSGDPYPGNTSNRALSVYTTPNSTLYNAADSFVRVTKISNCAATMTADLLYGYPTPILQVIDPSYSGPSSEGYTMTLTGSDFYYNSVVRWNGSDRTTYYDSVNQLRASITDADMADLGGPGNSATVTVFNPQPGGGVSSPRYFQIVDMATITPNIFLPLLFNQWVYGPAYLTLMTKTFEPDILGDNWEIIEESPGDYRWSRRNCRAYTGSFSAWSVGGGADGWILPCGSGYPNYADTSMTYGPFNTENGIVDGEVKFRMYINTEAGFDYLWVIADHGGTAKWGYKISGNSSGWVEGTLDLSNLDGLGTSIIGFPKVWVRFRFTSDYQGSSGEGAFLDDIVLRVCKSSSCTGAYSPALTPVMTSGTSGLIYEPVMITTEP